MSEEVTEDLKGWVLAFTGGAPLIGRLNVDERQEHFEGGGIVTIRTETLSPVYELEMQVKEDPQTRMGRVDWQCIPVGMFASFGSLTLPAYVVKKPCDELDQHDRRQILTAIRKGEDLVMRLRAGRAGLTLATGRG